MCNSRSPPNEGRSCWAPFDGLYSTRFAGPHWAWRNRRHAPPSDAVSDDAMPEADVPDSEGQQLAHAGTNELAANTMAMSELVSRVVASIACIVLRTNEKRPGASPVGRPPHFLSTLPSRDMVVTAGALLYDGWETVA